MKTNFIELSLLFLASLKCLELALAPTLPSFDFLPSYLTLADYRLFLGAFSYFLFLSFLMRLTLK